MTTEEDSRRKLAARRLNERVKLLYSTINAVAIGLLGAAFIVPGVLSASSLLEPHRWIWILAVPLHFVAYMIIGLLRNEE